MMILLAGGFALGGGPVLPSEADIVVLSLGAGILSGLAVALVLAILWGAACYWWREIRNYWRWVRLSRRVRLPIGPQIRETYRFRRNTDGTEI